MADTWLARIPKWDDFQHYKHRTPPWIKLHRSILDNREWSACSGEACKLLAECWLIASHGATPGQIDGTLEDFAWKVRRPSDVVASLLQELAAQGFILLCTQHASAPLAEGKQDAPLVEESTEESKSRNTDANASDGEPSPDEVPDLLDLDPADDDDWKVLRLAYFDPLRKHIWRGKRPPENVPNRARWNEGNELSILRNWLRAKELEADEVGPFFETARRMRRWDGPASLSWLNSKDAIIEVRDIIAEARKSMPVAPNVARITRGVLRAS